MGLIIFGLALMGWIVVGNLSYIGFKYVMCKRYPIANTNFEINLPSEFIYIMFVCFWILFAPASIAIAALYELYVNVISKIVDKFEN